MPAMLRTALQAGVTVSREDNEKNLSPQTRKELETMRKAALEGTLRDADLDTWKRKGTRAKDGVKDFLSKTRALRRRAATLDKIPPAAISHFDAAIQIIQGIMTGGKA